MKLNAFNQINHPNLFEASSVCWLDSATDGLLTTEAERFLLSLPNELEPNYLAVLRPQIINELAALVRYSRRFLNRIEELLANTFKFGLDFNLEKRIKDELRQLYNWLHNLSTTPLLTKY